MTSEEENTPIHVMANVKFPVPKFTTITNGSLGNKNESSDFQLSDSDEDEIRSYHSEVKYFEEEDDEEVLNALDSSESNGGGDQGYNLAELQEQLMMTVLEKQQLAEELKNVKEEQMNQIVKQLKLEKERNKLLVEQLKNKSSRSKSFHLKPDDSPSRRKSLKLLSKSETNLTRLRTMEEEDEDDDEIDRLSDPGVFGGEQSLISIQPRKVNRNWIQNIQDWIENWYEDIKEDFSEINDMSESSEDPFGEPLNIPKLKRNLIRSGNALDPLTDFIKDTSYIFRWEKPVVTFVIFLIYMYCIYQGLLITFVFALLTFLFIYAYFRQREWNTSSELAGRIDAREVEMNVGVRDQIAIILQVSRRAQNLSGQLCDIIEKIKNLILWKQPEITKQVMMCVVVGLCASLFFSASVLCSLAGYFVGIRLFIIEYIFYRFPRVQQKYDKFSHLYQELMSDVELQKRMRDHAAFLKGKTSKMGSTLSIPSFVTSRSRSSSVASSRRNSREILDNISIEVPANSSPSTTSSPFNNVFQLPNSEVPLPLWTTGRRCTLVNKDKPLTGTFRVGKMYLTNNYLCFERFKTPNPKNLAIPLSSIVKIDKAKLYNWLPGGGRVLEIKLKGFGKRLIFTFQTQLFGNIANRDEAYDNIMEIGRRNGYSWAFS